MTAPSLVQGPLVHREAAKEKSREADYFLRDVTSRDHGHSTEFRYWFNACVTAARSGFWFLRADDEDAFTSWEVSLPVGERDIMVAMRTARDVELHAGGAEMSPNKAVGRVPTPGTYRHTIEIIHEDGSHEVLPAVAALKVYLRLLRDKLGLVA